MEAIDALECILLGGSSTVWFMMVYTMCRANEAKERKGKKDTRDVRTIGKYWMGPFVWPFGQAGQLVG